MRELVHSALAEARGFVGQVVGDLRTESRLTDDEVLARYETQHRGNPLAIMRFAAQGQARGGDVLGEALRYEAEMERMRERMGQRVSG